MASVRTHLLQDIRTRVERAWGIDGARIHFFTQWERDLGADPHQIAQLCQEVAAAQGHPRLAPAVVDALETVGDLVALLAAGDPQGVPLPAGATEPNHGPTCYHRGKEMR